MLVLDKNIGNVIISIQSLLLLLLFCLWTNFVKAETDCTQVTEIPQIECEALIAFYNSTNGSNWQNSTGWNVNNAPCSWYKIICVNNHITSLDLYNNQLSGSIPLELGNLSNLQWLNLGNNQLSGSIPPELSNLSNLEMLYLGRNQLSGSIPLELGNLSNLQWLYLGNNQLSGSIPPELSNLSNLDILHLSSNQLSGSIPLELGNLSNLLALSLYNNQLSGSIPLELGNLSNLKWLDLDNNQLSGSIPPELSNLSNLDILHLSSNQLSGSIPLELGNLSNLLALSLIDNQLCGNIPFSLMNLSELFYLKLQGNALNIDNLDPDLEAFLSSHGATWQPQNPVPAVCKALLATLAFFEAQPNLTGVLLQWQTLVETNNAGFLIWRGQPTGLQCTSHPTDYHDIVTIDFKNREGNDFSGTTYFYQDNTVNPATTYCYLLEDRDFKAHSTFHWDSIASVTTP